MIEYEDKTLATLFTEARSAFGACDFLVIPEAQGRSYREQGASYTYEEAGRCIDALASALRDAGYGVGHRIAALLENRPEQVFLKFACAAIGASWVPINPDYRAAEFAFVLEDSAACLIFVTPNKVSLAMAAQEAWPDKSGLVVLDDFDPVEALTIPTAEQRASAAHPAGPQAEASLLYTSGTTGRPKGCILSHEYEAMVGTWYATRGGAMTVVEAQERIYNPLPLFHINAAVVSLLGAVLTGNCQIVPERFSKTAWWTDIARTKATVVHYLGLIVPVLMAVPESEQDRVHQVKWGMGAGVEPSLHGAFEKRFGFPLVEIWGMTEMCRLLSACEEPRQIDTRAMGRPVPGLEVRVVDEDDAEVPLGTPGEMTVRYSADTPRRGAFSGYLNLPEETEKAWRGGWFHTGDTVRQDQTGMIYFVDRKKNIIRRSGENIAAAEVEAVLAGSPLVAQVAVLAVADPVREEEVLACIVLKPGFEETQESAKAIFTHCFERLSYFKAPGWVLFQKTLPTTGTQKVLKHKILTKDADPIALGGFDFRALKKRSQG